MMSICSIVTQMLSMTILEFLNSDGRQQSSSSSHRKQQWTVWCNSLSYSNKSSSNSNRNFTLTLSLKYFKEHFLLRFYGIYRFVQMRCFIFQSCVPVYWYVQEIGLPVFYPVRCHTVAMLSFYKLLCFPFTFYICFFKTMMNSDFVAGTVPLSRLSILCYAVLYPIENLRTIEYCYQLELNYYTLQYRNFSLMKLVLIFCNQWKSVLFIAALKRSLDCTYF